MSANNIIIIKEQKDGTYVAYDRCVEQQSEREEEGRKVFEAVDERDAVLKAQEYMKEEIVEYGYYFSFLPND